MGKCHQCLIKNFNNFCALNSEELEQISTEKTEKSFKRGEVIFKEGSSPNGVYCVKHGKCKLSKLNSNGKEQIIRFIKDGDVLGYRSVISNETATLTVTALEEMNTCFIPKKEIIELLEKNPKFAMSILRTACSDLKDANMHISSMAQKNVKQRLAETLVFLHETFDTNNEGYIDIILSREEIANIVGTATESAIRILSELKKDKLIDLKGKNIKILDLKALVKITEDF